MPANGKIVLFDFLEEKECYTLEVYTPMPDGISHICIVGEEIHEETSIFGTGDRSVAGDLHIRQRLQSFHFGSSAV
jgi:hypothetical protein